MECCEKNVLKWFSYNIRMGENRMVNRVYLEGVGQTGKERGHRGGEGVAAGRRLSEMEGLLVAGSR